MSPHVERPPVLEARGLVKEYREGSTVRRVLDNVSLTVRRGRFLVVMGPSGSGKSTLLHLLGALDVPSQGDVLIEDRNIVTMSQRALTMLRRFEIGFVFQAFNLVPVLTVEENVRLPLSIARTPKHERADRIDAALELTGLVRHRRKLPSQLSGGEQQRVAIARALVHAPKVLLADEPTGSLDSASSESILSTLKLAQSELGQTIVVVTHDADVASYGDELLLLRDGAVERHFDFGAGTSVADTRDALAKEMAAGLPSLFNVRWPINSN